MIPFTLLHPRATDEHLGLIPYFLMEWDTRPAAEQFADRYVGGWSPMANWTFKGDGIICYPGAPCLAPIAVCQFREETIYIYEGAWVCIEQRDGTFEIARMD